MRRSLGLVTALALSASLAACGGTSHSDTAKQSAPAQHATKEWPRTITDADGKVTLKKQPKRIVSTSVVLTGSLLSLNTPVVGSAGTNPQAPGVDDQGFFDHWSKKAKKAGVESLYQNTELDLEAVAAAKPDLIVIAASGRDSTADAKTELEKIAPVVSINYNELDWRQTLDALAEATGTEKQAKQNEKGFDRLLASTKPKITVPKEPVDLVVFNPQKNSLAFALPNGPHADILKKLGFRYTKDLSAMSQDRGENRADFAFLSTENAIANLTQKDVLFVGGSEQDVENFRKNPSFANLPSVTDGKLVPLGSPSFKLDYYSAKDMVKHIAEAYAK